MYQTFRTILILSCVGGTLSAILLLIKTFTSKIFSASWQYYIWLVVLIAMILPVKFSKKPVEVSLIGETSMPEQTEIITASPEPLPVAETPDGVPVPVKEVEGGRFKLSFTYLLPIVWLSGAVIFFGGALISYWTFLFRKRKCPITIYGYEEFCCVKDKFGIKRKISLKRSDDLTAPMLVGLIKPVIYVPDREIGSEELTMVFMHELTHYKRRDLWYKWFSLAVNAIHWFNPFAYAAVKNINEACEMSCDVSVTKDMTDEEKKRYMNTIVALIKKGDRKNV